MYKKKLKEIHMTNTPKEQDLSIPNKFQPQSKKKAILTNTKRYDNFSKRNLPELKLSKLKPRVPSESDNKNEKKERMK